MLRLVPILIALFVCSAAHAGQILCFRLTTPNGYTDVKIDVQPGCRATGPALAPKFRAVHGLYRSFDSSGAESDGFLLAGTCIAYDDSVGLLAQAIGGSDLLNISGPTLESGNADLGNDAGGVSGAVVPVICTDLDL